MRNCWIFRAPGPAPWSSYPQLQPHSGCHHLATRAGQQRSNQQLHRVLQHLLRCPGGVHGGAEDARNPVHGEGEVVPLLQLQLPRGCLQQHRTKQPERFHDNILLHSSHHSISESIWSVLRQPTSKSAGDNLAGIELKWKPAHRIISLVSRPTAHRRAPKGPSGNHIRTGTRSGIKSKPCTFL